MYYRKELQHAGIKGMKWGVRRYQNPDGTLTEEGKKRYDNDPTNDGDRASAQDKYTRISKKQMSRNAKKAGLESLARDKEKSGVTFREANRNIAKARKESIDRDNLHNHKIAELNPNYKTAKGKVTAGIALSAIGGVLAGFRGSLGPIAGYVGLGATAVGNILGISGAIDWAKGRKGQQEKIQELRNKQQ